MASPRHSPTLSSPSAPLGNTGKATGWFPWHPSPTWKLLSSRNLISRRMRGTLIAFSHVLIMRLLMGFKNTTSFLNRFLGPGTHSLLCKHCVSKQVTAIPLPRFPGLLPWPGRPVPERFLGNYRLRPLPQLAFQVLKGPLHTSFLGKHPVLIAPLFSSEAALSIVQVTPDLLEQELVRARTRTSCLFHYGALGNRPSVCWGRLWVDRDRFESRPPPLTSCDTPGQSRTSSEPQCWYL